MSVLRGAQVLVTGASGFVGQAVLQACREAGANAVGMDRSRAFTDTLEDVRPTHVIHLAGVLPGAPGGSAVHDEANVRFTVRLFDAIRAAAMSPRILVASSSAVYGATTPEENPLTERHPFRPLTAYAVSKVAQEMLAVQAHLADGLPTIRVRTFNLIGPGQSRTLLASDLAGQIAEAEWGGRSATLRVGNLTPRRDYTDVRDAARAYVLLAAGGAPGEVYNVCSGRSWSVQECLDVLARLARVPVQVEVDAARQRAVEIPDQVGSAQRLNAATGWQPGIPVETSLRDLLDSWRQ